MCTLLRSHLKGDIRVFDMRLDCNSSCFKEEEVSLCGCRLLLSMWQGVESSDVSWQCVFVCTALCDSGI